MLRMGREDCAGGGSGFIGHSPRLLAAGFLVAESSWNPHESAESGRIGQIANLV